MALAPGYSRISRGGQIVKQSTGEILSRWEYNNARARDQGWGNYRDYLAAGKDPQYQKKLIGYAEQNNLDSKQARRLGSTYNTLYTNAFRGPDGEKLARRQRDQKKHGAIWRWLHEAGYIEDSDPWDYG